MWWQYSDAQSMARASQEDETQQGLDIYEGASACYLGQDLVLLIPLRASVRAISFDVTGRHAEIFFRMSYGTGRPAILKDDESIAQCRLLLQHPLAIEDDMRLVSTVELMALRERVHNKLSPKFDRPVDEHTFQVLREADMDFRAWYQTWDNAFSQKYEDAAFYRQSLQIQHMTAELFHNATALRGIDGPEDVQNMPPAQRELAIRSIQIGRQILEITVNSPAYREGMKYGV